jgi:RimJ/RimL family protein N-acetyltransferase
MFARTSRLLLRPGWIEDAPPLFDAIRDEAIVCNLASAPWPYSMTDAEAFLRSERSPATPSMLIFRRTDGAPELVGTIGIGRDPAGEMELGYWIGRAFWGRGYATEAGRAVIGMARDGLRLRKLKAGHFVDNPASGRVLEKLGFRRASTIVPRFSAGRGEAAPSRLFELELGEDAVVPAAAVAHPKMLAA